MIILKIERYKLMVNGDHAQIRDPESGWKPSLKN
jgi:hypothetical protein